MDKSLVLSTAVVAIEHAIKANEEINPITIRNFITIISIEFR